MEAVQREHSGSSGSQSCFVWLKTNSHWPPETREGPALYFIPLALRLRWSPAAGRTLKSTGCAAAWEASLGRLCVSVPHVVWLRPLLELLLSLLPLSEAPLSPGAPRVLWATRGPRSAPTTRGPRGEHLHHHRHRHCQHPPIVPHHQHHHLLCIKSLHTLRE